MDLDAIDRRILSAYQRNTRLAGEQIGAQVGLSAAAVQRRLKRLRETGVIVADIAVLDCASLGLNLTAIVHVDLVDESARASAAFRDKLTARDDVQQCYGVAGAVDFVLVVIVPDLPAYEAFCEACLLHDANVRSFTTHIVLEAAKRGGALRIP
jgi:Lrp/AsnC family transcriptional regulator, leucine-responsive regulatory protein